MSQSVPATIPGVQLQIANDLSATPQPIVDSSTGTLSMLQISTGNIVVTSGGNLGVGTNPDWPLHVGTGQTVKFELGNGALFVLGAPGVFGIDSNDTAAGRFIVTDNGNVGINQPNPTYTLDVWGTMNVTGQFANPGIPSASTAPDPTTLKTVVVDPKTGILYFQN